MTMAGDKKVEFRKICDAHESLMPSKEEPYAVAGGMSAIKNILGQGGVYLFTRPDFVAIAPALNIPEDLMMEGLRALSTSLWTLPMIVWSRRAPRWSDVGNSGATSDFCNRVFRQQGDGKSMEQGRVPDRP